MKSSRPSAAAGFIEALWSRYVSDRDPATRRQLLDQYIGLVHHAAREMAVRLPRDLELHDLISAGTIGLVQALECFEPSRGLAFSTYATPRIRGAILDELRKWDWVPRSVREQGRELEHARSELQQRLGRQPDSSEMAAQMGRELHEYWRSAREAERPVVVALDASGRPSELQGPRLCDVLADPNAVDPARRVAHDETFAELRDAVEQLPPKDQLVLSLYYYEELTMREIGEVLHISESRVSQIHSRLLERLRERVSMKGEAA